MIFLFRTELCIFSDVRKRNKQRKKERKKKERKKVRTVVCCS